LVISDINGQPNYQKWGLTEPIPLLKWTKIKIYQSRLPDGLYKFGIQIGKENFHEMINANPYKFRNVKVKTGSDSTKPAFALINNFRVKTRGAESIFFKRSF